MQTHSNTDSSRPVLIRHAGAQTIFMLFVIAVVMLVFRTFPGIDVVFNDLFFTERDCNEVIEGVRCGQFLLLHDPVWSTLREIGHETPLVLMALVCLNMTWLMMFNPNKTMAQLYPPIVAIISGLLGPLLLVNLVLKEHWGRPRPMQTLFFGGKDPYVLPGDISTYCESNCSFVSGEAAAAFWLVGLMFYFSGRNRLRYFIVAFIIASGIALLRVTFGRHYISDVVVAGLSSVMLISFAVWILQTEIIRRWLAVMLKFSNTYAFGRRNMRN